MPWLGGPPGAGDHIDWKTVSLLERCCAGCLYWRNNFFKFENQPIRKTRELKCLLSQLLAPG